MRDDQTDYGTHDGRDAGQPQRGNDTPALKYIVTRHAELNARAKEIKFEQKELEDSAWEKCGKSPKAIKQLSKESAWDEVRRERQRLLEEEIDAGRVSLGMLAGTPLGEAEMARMQEERQGSVVPIRAPGKRGRPPGSKNRPKAAV